MLCGMKLWAISDLHLGFGANRTAVQALGARPDDWLIVAGDVGETEAHMRLAFEVLGTKFRRLVWVPGNHELYRSRGDPDAPRGADKYAAMVAQCRAAGVLTPEDEYPVWEGEGGPHVIAPLFLGYDYSFRPPEVSEEGAVAWCAETGVVAADEELLDPHPYPSRQAWCTARVADAEARLARAPDLPLVLVNHYPLREDLAVLPRIPRFKIWCGTKATEDWHRRYRAAVVVSGHLHIPRTSWIDGVRFEEVSLGYPRQRYRGPDIESYLREILPGPSARGA